MKEMSPKAAERRRNGKHNREVKRDGEEARGLTCVLPEFQKWVLGTLAETQVQREEELSFPELSKSANPQIQKAQ